MTILVHSGILQPRETANEGLSQTGKNTKKWKAPICSSLEIGARRNHEKAISTLNKNNNDTLAIITNKRRKGRYRTNVAPTHSQENIISNPVLSFVHK